jgi:hypothetical protein
MLLCTVPIEVYYNDEFIRSNVRPQRHIVIIGVDTERVHILYIFYHCIILIYAYRYPII